MVIELRVVQFTGNRRVRLNRVGGWVVGGRVEGRGSWIMGRACLKIKERYVLAPSVLGPNLQLPAHELISPNSFYETLNKGKLSPINYKHFSFWSGKQFR